jgi:hypothetical protein
MCYALFLVTVLTVCSKNVSTTTAANSSPPTTKLKRKMGENDSPRTPKKVKNGEADEYVCSLLFECLLTTLKSLKEPADEEKRRRIVRINVVIGNK